MLIVISALKGYAVEADDGLIGKVADFLFDDLTWKLRWLVVDAGSWLTERKVLIHPSVIGKPDYEREELRVRLTKARIEASPPILEHEPVSMQRENRLYNYYGWDPMWGNSYFGVGGMLGTPLAATPGWNVDARRDAVDRDADVLEREDPHLRSIAEVKGYHIRALDGEIGHAENFLIDDADWDIRYVIIDTRNWWPGKHVLISPYAVNSIDWKGREIRLGTDRELVKSSPPWDPIAMIDQVYEKRLHHHYDWPGYAF